MIAGVRFVKTSAERLHARPDGLGLIGGSSGGHLLLLAAIRPNAAEYATTPYVGQDGGFVDAAVAYALPLWPIADPLARYRYLLDRIAHPRPTREAFFQPELLKQAHEAFFGDEATMSRASVPRIVTAGEAECLPPMWIAHPELDENVTVAMTDHLVDTYRQAGGQAEVVIFPDVGHSFANFPGSEADVCIAQMKTFVAAQLARLDR